MVRSMGTPATLDTWLIALLIGLIMGSPLAVGAVNRRFQRREQQPQRGVVVGRRALQPEERAFLQRLTRDVQTFQTIRKRRAITGYVGRVGDVGVAARTYRLGRGGAYVGIADLTADAPQLEYHASWLFLLLRVLVLLVVAVLAFVLDLPWWVGLILVALVAWVFWFDHSNEKSDLDAHLRHVIRQSAPSNPAPAAGRRARPETKKRSQAK